MTRERFEEFISRYNEILEEGYSYEDMCHFLLNNIDDFISVADKYFDHFDSKD